MNKIKLLAVVSALAASALLMASCAEDIKDNISNNKDVSSSATEVTNNSSANAESNSDSEKTKDDKDKTSDSKTNDGNNSAANGSDNNNSQAQNDSSKSGKIEIIDELDLDALDSNGSVAPNAEQGWGALM